MGTYFEKELLKQKVVKQKNDSSQTSQYVDNRPEAVKLSNLQEKSNNSLQVNQAVQLQSMADRYSFQQQKTIQNKENNVVQRIELPDHETVKNLLYNAPTSIDEGIGMAGNAANSFLHSDNPYAQQMVSA